MNVVNIGIDKTLVGGKPLGDAIERHRKYGRFLNHLDIIVYTNKRDGLKAYTIADNVIGFPTNSYGKLFFFFDTIRLFKKINAQHPVDLVVCQDPFISGLIGWWLKRTYSVKLLIHFHGDFWGNPHWLKERSLHYLFFIISKFTVHRADAIRVMSMRQKEKLINAGVSERKVRVISTPVNLYKYQTVDIKNVSQYKKDGEQMVLHVSRNSAVKDFKTLFFAWSAVHHSERSVHFWQVGAGLAINELKKKFPELEHFFATAHLHLLGATPAEEMVPIFQAADIFVLSSRSESFGKVLVEANACGKPVVATATTGAKEIIRDTYNGYVVPIGDYRAMAEKIIFLLNNLEKATEMGNNGRMLVFNRFNNTIDAISQYWNDIVQ